MGLIEEANFNLFFYAVGRENFGATSGFSEDALFANEPDLFSGNPDAYRANIFFERGRYMRNLLFARSSQTIENNAVGGSTEVNANSSPEELLRDPRVRAMLDVIAYAEGTKGNGDYRRVVYGNVIGPFNANAPYDRSLVGRVPPHRLRTAQARAALPSEVPLADAVFNTAHAALVVLGLVQGDFDLLRRGLHDRIHQPRRAHLYPESIRVMERARAAGALGATVSGAGPAVLVWAHYEQTGALAEALRREADGWAVVRTPFEPQGADVRAL